MYPIRAKLVCTRGRARAVVIVVWLAALVLAAPILIGRKLQQVRRLLRLRAVFSFTCACMLFVLHRNGLFVPWILNDFLANVENKLCL